MFNELTNIFPQLIDSGILLALLVASILWMRKVGKDGEQAVARGEIKAKGPTRLTRMHGAQKAKPLSITEWAVRSAYAQDENECPTLTFFYVVPGSPFPRLYLD